MLDASSPPSWLRPASLRWVDASGQFYGLGATRLSLGGPSEPRTPEWSRAWSDVVHSHRTLDALRNAGVTAITIHFDQGLGPSAQADEYRRSARFAKACREFGIRVFGRIEAGAIHYETLLADRPGVAAWAQRDSRGDIVHADGLPAWRPCYRSRGYLELLKDSISVACEQIGVDGIHLSDLGPHTCRCERCQAAFRTLLASQHPEPAVTLGLPSIEHVRLPECPSVNDPLRHVAAYFEVYVLRNALAELRIHLRSLSAQVALWAEPRLSDPSTVSSCTALWELSAAADVITCPVPDTEAGVRARVHAYLAGHGTRTRVCVSATGPPAPATLHAELAPALAFGGHILASHGALLPAGSAMSPRFTVDGDAQRAWQRLLAFAARHEHYHHRATSIADVALAFSTTDVGAEPHERAGFEAAEQALIDAGVPFDLVPIEQADASRHPQLIIAGQPRMHDAEGEALREAAQAGAGLLLIGDAGTHDPCGRRRRTDLFRESEDTGRIVRLESADELPTAIASLLSEPQAVVIEGGAEHAGRVIVRPFRLPTGQGALHLANAGGNPIADLRLRIRRDLAPGGHIAWHDPGSTDQMLDCAADGDTVLTALPPLHAYALIVTS